MLNSLAQKYIILILLFPYINSNYFDFMQSLKLMDQTVDSTWLMAKKRKWNQLLLTDFTIFKLYLPIKLYLPDDSLLLNRCIAPLLLGTPLVVNLSTPLNSQMMDRFSYLAAITTACFYGLLVMLLTVKTPTHKIPKWILNMNASSCLLPMTQDNERIFSGSKDKKVLIHDATT